MMHAAVDIHHHRRHHNLPPRLARVVHPFPSYPPPLPPRNLPPRHRHVYSPPSSQYQTRPLPLPLPLPCRAPNRPSRPLLPLSYIFQGPFHDVNNNSHQQPLFFKWAKPIGRFCTLNTDGSVSSHRSGVGGILRDSRGAPLVAFAAMCPSNIPIYGVELIAIMRGLQVAISSGVHYINIDTDSSEAVKYVFSPPSSCPILIRSFISEIHSLLAQFKSWNCKHIFRETNRAADFLAKFAGTNELLLDPMQFPFELQKIINEDARGVLYLRLKSVGMS